MVLGEARLTLRSLVVAPVARTERRSPTPVAGQRLPSPATGRRTPAPAASTSGGGVHGKCGNARVDVPEASGRSEGDTLGSVVGRRQRSVGPEEGHGQTQHERLVRVSDLNFLLRIHLPDSPIPLASTFSSLSALLQGHHQGCGLPRANQGP